MSELRQRRGAAAKEKEAALVEGGDSPVSQEEAMKQLQGLIESMRPHPKPGLTNEAKVWKDKLEEDPYNLKLMMELGTAYANDEQWDRSVNVLLRGWKRTSELSEVQERFQYLAILAEGSFEIKKFRQSLAVVYDIDKLEASEAIDIPKPYEVLKCKVFCMNDDLQRGLKAFNKAIEGQDFITAGQFWTACAYALKQVGAYETTKATMLKHCKTDEEREKLEMLEKIGDLKASIIKGDEDAEAQRQKNRKVVYLFIVAAVSFLTYFLYVLETQSLEKLKLTK